MSFQESVEGARTAFWQTIQLKLDQFHQFVGKGSNSALSGAFIEELVRGFVRSWINPCLLLHGTLHPFDRNPDCTNPPVRQIDGIVFDPRQGPSVIREGEFIVAHPQFCPGIIEIKKSCDDLTEFEQRLQKLHRQYYCYQNMVSNFRSSVMGIVIHDRDPEKHSHPDWVTMDKSLYESKYGQHCPIFILFKEVEAGVRYEPYAPAIDEMMQTIFAQGWSLDHRLPKLEREIHTNQLLTRSYQ